MLSSATLHHPVWVAPDHLNPDPWWSDLLRQNSINMTDTSQDIGYRNRSTPSGLVRRTYDVGPAPSPPASHTTYTAASLSNVPLPRTMTYTCTRTSPSSTQPLYQTETFSAGNPIRRSVSGMKTLLPLKLTSVAPDMGSWPQSAPSHRTTFGMRLSLRIERPSSTSESAENGKSRRKSPPSRPRRHRDTPIYTEPGVQLPGPAYLNANSIRRRCAPQDSTCDEACIINEYDEEKRRQHEHDLESFQVSTVLFDPRRDTHRCIGNYRRNMRSRSQARSNITVLRLVFSVFR